MDVNNPPAVFFQPAIDWLTIATYNWQGYVDTIAWLRREYKTWRPGRWLQYSGWKNADGIFYGSAIQSNDKEHFVIRVSGGFADQFAQQLLELSCADHWYCTRIDVQVTRARPEWWDVRELHDHFLLAGRTVSSIQSETGNTLYLGTRTSGRFTRFYEKDLGRGTLAESLLVRCEIELKGSYARTAYQLLLEGASVTDMYAYHLGKLKLPEYMEQDYSPAGHEPIEWYTAIRQDDMRRKLGWLNTLLPTFNRMLNDHDIGEATREIFVSLAYPPLDIRDDKSDN